MTIKAIFLLIVLFRTGYSLSALANSSSSKYPCQHTTIEKGWVHSTDCSGYFTISTMTETLTLACSKLGSRVVAGPILLDMHHCEYRGNGLPTCLPAAEMSYFGIPPCTALNTPFTTCSILIIVFLFIFNYVMCRFLWVRLKFRPIGTSVIYRTNEVFCFEIAYSKKVNPGVKYESAEEQAIVECAHKSRISYRFTLRALILLCLFFIRPVTTVPLPAGGPDNPTQQHIGTYHVSVGQEIEVAGWRLKVKEAAYHLILAPGYKTSQCKSNLVGDWHCTSVCYINGGVCKGYGPGGVIKKNSPKMIGKDRIPSESVIEFCMPGTTGCFASNGCWKWNIHVKYEVHDVHEVHMIDDLLPILEYDVITPGDGFLPSLDISYALSMVGSCVIKNRDGRMWLCQECSKTSHPKLGHIGDVQFDGAGEALLPLGFSTCVKDTYGGPQCSIVDCALKSNLAQCSVIGGSVSHSPVSSKGSALFYTPNSGVTVKASKPAGTLEGSPNNNCGQLSICLWIIANSDKPAILSIKVDGDSFHHSSVWQDPCSKERWIIPCNGQTVHVEASWPYECYAKDKTIDIRTEHHSIAHVEGYEQLSWDSGHSTTFWGVGGLFDWLHLPSVIGALGFNIIIFFVVVFVVCKK